MADCKVQRPRLAPRSRAGASDLSPTARVLEWGRASQGRHRLPCPRSTSLLIDGRAAPGTLGWSVAGGLGFQTWVGGDFWGFHHGGAVGRMWASALGRRGAPDAGRLSAWPSDMTPRTVWSMPVETPVREKVLEALVGRYVWDGQAEAQ